MPLKSIEKRKLYCILDLDLPYLRKDPISITADLIAGGADVIQLRSKSYPAKYIIEIGKKIRPLTQKNKVIFIANDRVDIAVAVQADGVHLGQEDLPPDVARRLLGKDKIIGLSTHSLIQARTAQNYAIDYISVGPIFRSLTKPELKAIGTETLREIAGISNLPIVAIGGIDMHNLEEVLCQGADSIAFISAILNSRGIEKKTREFKKKMNNFYKNPFFYPCQSVFKGGFSALTK